MEDSQSSSLNIPKVGVMTFHWAHNYGAFLQGYALCQFLHKKMHLEVRLVDFVTGRQEAVNDIMPKIRWGIQLPKSLSLFLLMLFHYRSLSRRKSRFLQFAHECFAYTQRYRDFDDLRSNPPKFDAVITGSDQVFNYRILSDKELSAYCLSAFSSMETRKIAFAPSFGSNSLTLEVKNKMAIDLKDFQRLSARETEGAVMLEEMTGMPAMVLLDPVFLLEENDWKKFSRPVENIPPAYILCYALNGRKSLGNIALKVKSLTGLPIVLVSSNVRSGIKADRTVYDAGPREFLWLIEHARYVVTDSFHGAAFSILFEKDFFAHIIITQSAQRIVGMLKRFGQENRLISQSVDINIESLPADYAKCRQVIVKEREKSFNYLRESLFESAHRLKRE